MLFISLNIIYGVEIKDDNNKILIKKRRNKMKTRDGYWKEPVTSWGQRRWQRWVLWFGVMGFTLFLVLGFVKNEIEWTVVDGRANAKYILSTMTEKENLPWDNSQNRLLGVIVCPYQAPIFLTHGKSVSSEVMGCEYQLAEGTHIRFESKPFKPVGVLVFEKTDY